jgi:hypothetical protein
VLLAAQLLFVFVEDLALAAVAVEGSGRRPGCWNQGPKEPLKDNFGILELVAGDFEHKGTEETETEKTEQAE